MAALSMRYASATQEDDAQSRSTGVDVQRAKSTTARTIDICVDAPAEVGTSELRRRHRAGAFPDTQPEYFRNALLLSQSPKIDMSLSA